MYLFVILLRFNILQMNIMDSHLFFEGTVHLFKRHYVDNERFIRGGDVLSNRSSPTFREKCAGEMPPKA